MLSPAEASIIVTTTGAALIIVGLLFHHKVAILYRGFIGMGALMLSIAAFGVGLDVLVRIIR